MGETRAGKYGRNLAIWINYTFQTIPSDHREDYKKRFISELKRYSLKPRAEGEPRNEGCVQELSDLVAAEISNPEHLARLVKEGIHLMYQKQTSARVLKALEESL